LPQVCHKFRKSYKSLSQAWDTRGQECIKFGSIKSVNNKVIALLGIQPERAIALFPVNEVTFIMSDLIYNQVHRLDELGELGSINNQVIRVGDADDIDSSFATEFLNRFPQNAVLAQASPFACLTTAPEGLDPEFVETHGVYLLGGGSQND
jgi:hypothetical protein